jgi:hypothetical protein
MTKESVAQFDPALDIRVGSWRLYAVALMFQAARIPHAG